MTLDIKTLREEFNRGCYWSHPYTDSDGTKCYHDSNLPPCLIIKTGECPRPTAPDKLLDSTRSH